MKTVALLSLVAVAAVAFVGAAPTAPAIPNTPAGRALHAWFVAFDSGNRATYRRFMQTEEPARLSRLNGDMDFRQMTGGFDLKKIERSAPTRIVALVEDRLNEQFARLTLTVNNAPPNTIRAIDLEAISRPAEFALARLSASGLVDALRTKLRQDAAVGRFAGAVLVAHNGQPIFEQAYGLADREHRIPNTLQTRFRIGSMNKMFTAVSIMQLVQAGKIGLDDPLGKILTDYPNKDVAAQVTIRELLTHTGGTGDIFGPEFATHRLQLRTLADYEKLYGTRAPLFKPGARFDYSNYGFILLGLVVEKVSGQSYYDYVRDHVYAPAGMTSTGSQPEDQPVPNTSIGYTQSPHGRWQPNTDTLPYRGTSAGGGYSTVGDLVRFANALQNHTLLDAAHTDMMTTGKIDMPGGKYDFGFGESIINGVRCFGHNGGAPGMNGDLEICPLPGYVVAVLANMDPPAAGRISDFITNRFPAR